MTMPNHADLTELEPLDDEAIVLDVFVQHTQQNGPHAVLTAEALLESTQLSRALLTEAIEKLEAEGRVEVRWNLNGTFTAKLTS